MYWTREYEKKNFFLSMGRKTKQKDDEDAPVGSPVKTVVGKGETKKKTRMVTAGKMKHNATIKDFLAKTMIKQSTLEAREALDKMHDTLLTDLVDFATMNCPHGRKTMKTPQACAAAYQFLFARCSDPYALITRLDNQLPPFAKTLRSE